LLLLVPSLGHAQSAESMDPGRSATFGLAGWTWPANGSESSWQIEIAPYLWAASLDGTVGVSDRTANVDVSFRKLLEHLDGAIMLAGEARHGRFGFGLDLIYVSVSDESATPGPLFSSADFKSTEVILEFSPRFRVVYTPRVALDLLAGGRFWKLDNELTLGAGALPGVRLDLEESWIDPFVGARVLANASRRLVLQARGDVGGFDVNSEFTWQALGLLGIRFGDRYSVRAGYRHLDVDFENDSGFIYDVAMSGPILGLTIAF
jgi:hypothetical protein